MSFINCCIPRKDFIKNQEETENNFTGFFDKHEFDMKSNSINKSYNINDADIIIENFKSKAKYYNTDTIITGVDEDAKKTTTNSVSELNSKYKYVSKHKNIQSFKSDKKEIINFDFLEKDFIQGINCSNSRNEKSLINNENKINDLESEKIKNLNFDEKLYYKTTLTSKCVSPKIKSIKNHGSNFKLLRVNELELKYMKQNSIYSSNYNNSAYLSKLNKISESEIESNSIIEIMEIQGNILNTESIKINARGLEHGSLRNKMDGQTKFGNNDKINNEYINDYELNLDLKFHPTVFQIFFDRTLKKYFISSFGNYHELSMVFVKLNKPFVGF